MKTKAGMPYGFSMSWQNAAYRWLPFLYQHGGTMLNEDLTSLACSATPKGIETIAWTQSWFKEGLVPPSTSIKSTEQPQNLFANGTIGLVIAGDWQIPFISKNMTKFDWGVTYMPRDVAMASDLGGNCLAVSRDSKNPDAAADVREVHDRCRANMRDFVVNGAVAAGAQVAVVGEAALCASSGGDAGVHRTDPQRSRRIWLAPSQCRRSARSMPR